MKGYKVFMINGKLKNLPLYEKGDIVKIPEDDSLASEPVIGTVKSTEHGGLFVRVEWDKEVYPCKLGGTVRIGEQRMVDGLELFSK
jgi:hypothetical protein